MDWQLTIAWSAVGLAGAYVLWRGWQTWRGLKTGCSSGGCGCAKKAPETNAIAPEGLSLRKHPTK